jgi:mannose-1-phosphate guanylyltransferase/mannose-6-phosphate isomerase
LSVPETPKQFLPLISSHSLLQETVLRLAGLPDCQSPVVVCNQQHRFTVAQHLQVVMPKLPSILLEPVGRNTAPAAAVAALFIARHNPDALLLVLPSDHAVTQPERFHQAILQAAPLARQGNLVILGIHPTEAKTEYGYIKQGAAQASGYPVQRFVEKPHLSLAKQLVDDGYLWNSGIFLFQAQAFLAELERWHPQVLASCRLALTHALQEHDFCWLNEAPFSACPSISIDYAIMEKTENAFVIPVDMGWSDVGSWDALWLANPQDAEGNVIRGNVRQVATTNSLIMAHSKPTAVIGLDNIVVVDTEDGLLVAKKDQPQAIRSAAVVARQISRNISVE